jgi:hypothetical protein
MSPHKAAIASASIPLVAGIAGLFKLGRFDWIVFLLSVLLAAFLYRSAFVRAKNEAKYGKPPVNSALLKNLQKRR